MSAVAAPSGARLEPRARPAAVDSAAPTSRPGVRVLTFSALGFYGSLRWASLVAPAATVRMLVVLALAVAIGGILAKRAQLGGLCRLLAAAGVLALLVVSLPVCGVPLTLLIHHHLGTIVNGIGLGLTALPRVMVPYAGANVWARTVILLGGGLLLLDAGILLAFVPHSLGDARRAGAALPLIALAVVPAALEREHAEYLQGLLLFVLVAAFVWGERLRRREVLPAVAVAGLAGVVGALAAPGLNTHRPVLNYQSLVNSLSPAGVETFQWYQGYGPYTWPTHGRQVLLVDAHRAEFWKTENLDDFDGRGWVQAQPNLSAVGIEAPAAPGPALSSATAWTQTLRVTIGAMYTGDIIASGMAQPPADLPAGVSAGASPGTWISNRQLGPGDAYLVRVYAPNPSPAQLADAGRSYPRMLRYYRQIFLPASGARSAAGAIVFPEFGAPATARAGRVAAILASSDYAGAYRMATTLAAGAATPYAFVARVENYLRSNYTYSLNAPFSSNPIETFLFKDKYGYCQQFAGAMALLVRMGGIPARVAVGFAPGTYSAASREYVIRDTDAHAWVEVWFPRYGWVAFDPTPPVGATPALRAHGGGASPAGRSARIKDRVAALKPTKGLHRHGGLGMGAALLAVIVFLVLGLGGGGVALRIRRRARESTSSDELLAELERALRRSGFEFTPATTLAELERRFRRSPGAADYVRAVGRARYGGGVEPPTPAQRQALRAHLAEVLGPFGRVWAMWALPPRI